MNYYILCDDFDNEYLHMMYLCVKTNAKLKIVQRTNFIFYIASYKMWSATQTR